MSEDIFRWVIAGGVGVAALCIAIMAGVLIAIYKAVGGLQDRSDDLSAKVYPVIDIVNRLATENAPKISDITTSAQVIAANAREISEEAKDQAHRFAEVGRDIADRTKVQVARADAAVDETVEQLHVAGVHAKAAILKPVREATAVAAGIKAAVSTYAAGRRTPIDHITQDEEMFI